MMPGFERLSGNFCERSAKRSERAEKSGDQSGAVNGTRKKRAEREVAERERSRNVNGLYLPLMAAQVLQSSVH